MTYLNDVHGIIVGGMLLSTEIECGYTKGVLKTYNIRQEDRGDRLCLHMDSRRTKRPLEI